MRIDCTVEKDKGCRETKMPMEKQKANREMEEKIKCSGWGTVLWEHREKLKSCSANGQT